MRFLNTIYAEIAKKKKEKKKLPSLLAGCFGPAMLSPTGHKQKCD